MKSNEGGVRTAARCFRAVVLGTLGWAIGTTCAQPTGEDGRHEDLLRFLNGDSLHGRFEGMPEGAVIRWRHADARDPIVLETGKLRHLALNGGRAREALRSTSFVLLTDGDRVPGTITSLDDEKLTIETEVAGTLTIPRQFIRQIAPNPHGGAVHYVGPFTDGEWTVIEPPAEEEEEKDEAAEDPNEEEDAPATADEAPWVFSGGAYYSNGQLPIAIDTHAPDKTRIRFTLAWRNRLNAAIAFHATMKTPEPAEEDGDDPGEEPAAGAQRRLAARDAGGSNGFATTYGESYVLTIYSNYAQLYRCTFDEDGDPEMDRLSTSSANLRLEEAGEAEFDLRCDREEGSITLFADGRYISQWEDTRGYAGQGSHLAFACQSSSSRLRISDVIVTSWNGMIDSARSMEVDDRDIILLANGMDRFSGTVSSLKDGKFQIEGTYAGMQIPIQEVQEIRLASAPKVEESEESSNAIRLLLQPFGRLTLLPLHSTADRMNARHAALGELSLDLRHAGLLEFSFTDSVLDAWDDDF